MNLIYVENKHMELKREYTDNLLKSVSAFANYDGGKIIVGIEEKDNVIIGVDNFAATKLEIEHRINDTIEPRPRFDINVILVSNKHILEIVIYPGLNTPYLYKGIAYQRSDTSTLPVDQTALMELSLKGKNMSYDQIKTDETNLEFSVLKEKLNTVRPVENFDKDVLVTLGLFTNNKYNIAAELLADINTFSNTGIDIVRFGSSISIFLDRKVLSGISILTQYDETLNMFKKHFPEVDVVEGLNRVKKVSIPYEAFRESVANAIAHRNYLINAHIKIEMFDNRIEIISPGGLPSGITKENYLKDNLSIPRNMAVSHVFHTLNIIERFGTGIRRINLAYFDYERKPRFVIKESFIKVILPNVLFDDSNMNDETRILNMLDVKVEITRKDVENLLSISKTKAVELLNKLRANDLIESFGEGKNVLYIKK